MVSPLMTSASSIVPNPPLGSDVSDFLGGFAGFIVLLGVVGPDRGDNPGKCFLNVKAFGSEGRSGQGGN